MAKRNIINVNKNHIDFFDAVVQDKIPTTAKQDIVLDALYAEQRNHSVMRTEQPTWATMMYHVINPHVVEGVTSAMYDAFPKTSDDPDMVSQTLIKSQNAYILGSPVCGWERFPKAKDDTEELITDIDKIKYAHRGMLNISKRSAVVLDIDDITTTEFAALKASLAQAPYLTAMHTTVNHKRKNAHDIMANIIDLDAKQVFADDPQNTPFLADDGFYNKCRVIVPFLGGINRDDYEYYTRETARILGVETLDAACTRVAQVMYLPILLQDQHRADMNHKGYEYAINGRYALSTDLIDALTQADSTDRKTWYYAKNEDPQKKMAQALKRVRQDGVTTEKKGIIGDILTAVSIHTALEHVSEYIPMGDLYQYVGSTSGSSGGIVIDDTVFYSHHQSDPLAGRAYNAFDLIRYYLHDGEADDMDNETVPMHQRDSYKQTVAWYMDNFGKELLKVQSARVPSIVHTTHTNNEVKDMTTDMTIQNDTFLEVVEEQKEKAKNALVYTKYDKLAASYQKRNITPHIDEYKSVLSLAPYLPIAYDKEGKSATINLGTRNLKTLLTTAPHFSGRIIWDNDADAPSFICPTPFPFDDEKNVEGMQLIIDTDMITALYVWLTDADLCVPDMYCKLNLSKNQLDDVVTAIARANKRYPIRDFLFSLKGEWDGVERVETLFVDMLGAEDNALSREAARRMMIAGAMRQLMPDFVKYDTIVVLRGAQGVGKSTLVSALACGYFTDSIDDIDTQKLGEALTGTWFAELAEMSIAQKFSSNDLKRMVTSEGYKYRAAYARHAHTATMRSVYVGTTNDNAFLKDTTGNRRYDIIDCKHGDKKHTLDHKYVQQLWAETMHIISNGDTTTYVREDNPRFSEYKRLAELKRSSAMSVDKTGDMVRDAVTLHADDHAEMLYAGYEGAYYAPRVSIQMLWEKIYREPYSSSKQHNKKRDEIRHAIEQLGLYELVTADDGTKARARIKGYANYKAHYDVYALIDTSRVQPHDTNTALLDGLGVIDNNERTPYKATMAGLLDACIKMQPCADWEDKLKANEHDVDAFKAKIHNTNVNPFQ